jgi:hypothetical protein
MMMDLSHPRMTTLLGIFTGRLVAVHSNGDGEVRGYCGPHDVVVPGSLMDGIRPGGDISYYATQMPSGLAVASRLFRTRNL